MDGSLQNILYLIGPGPLAAIVVLAWILVPVYRKHVKALERDLILRRCQIRVLQAVAEWLKGEGHEITVPDLTEEI